MSAEPATAHRTTARPVRPARRTPAPRAPRRRSGPARGRARTAPRTTPRPAPRRAVAAAGTARGVALPRPFAPRALEALVRLPDSRWLDRLVRGRAWIALIGMALMGLVFMQVSMLKMNAGIGQAVERSAELERRNADLRAAVSELSSEERIQAEAAAMGLVMPPAGDVRFLTSRGTKADARRAAKVMREPTPEALQIEQLAAAGMLAPATDETAAAAAGAVAGEPAPGAAVDPATGQPAVADPAAATPAPTEQTQAAPTAGAEAPPAATGQPVADQQAAPAQAQAPVTEQQQPTTAATGAAVAPTG